MNTEDVLRFILEKTRKAVSAKDVEEILKVLDKQNIADWRPVGGRENNPPTIDLASKPTLPLIERIINSMDALIERHIEEKRIKNPKAKVPNNPRQAAEEMGIDKIYWKTRTPKKIRSKAEKIKVVFVNGGSKSKPSIAIIDEGSGQAPKDFPKTFVGLNENTKINKPYLVGVFGQGGATSFKYAKYTIIISRVPPSITKTEGSHIAWTIVRYNPRLGEGRRGGTYEYMVNKKTGEIFYTSAEKLIPLKIFGHKWKEGSIVLMVDYEIGGYLTSLTTTERHLQWELFEPVLPFMFYDQREEKETKKTEKKRRESRPIKGLNRTLSTNKAFEKGTMIIPFDKLGKIEILFWVVKAQGPAKVSNYVRASDVVSFTYLGQVVMTKGKNLVKKMGLGLIKDDIIIQVRLDLLTPDGFRMLLAPTRDRFFESSEIYTRLFEELIYGLRKDDTLQKILEEKRKELQKKYFKQKNIKKLQNEFKKRISFWKIKRDTIPLTTVPGSTVLEEIEQKEKIPSKFESRDPPSIFEITNKQPIQASPGKRILFRFFSNAPDNYRGYDQIRILVNDVPINEREDFILLSRIKPKEGRSSISMKSRDDEKLIGKKYVIEFYLPRENDISLKTEARVEIVPPQEKKQKSKRKTKEKPKADQSLSIKIIPQEPGTMPPEKVGDIVQQGNELWIKINMGFKDFEKTMKRIDPEKYASTTLETIRENYLIATGITLLSFETEIENNIEREPSQQDNSSVPDEILDKWKAITARGIIEAVSRGKRIYEEEGEEV